MSLRLARLALLLALAALVAPTVASAAPRMWMGFQDDPSLRWLESREFYRDRSRDVGATVVKTTVYWYDVAARRPGNASNPFDRAYKWDDLDELVRAAQWRGQEMMLVVWGTPSWAGPARNAMPRRLGDLTNFTRALASRYSGRFPGLPHVRFYGVWNEPNLQLFLRPQFDRRGRSVAPRLYARLYRAGYAGLKAGNPRALVGIGETSARGRDRKVPGLSENHSPGRFAQLVAKADRRLRFDAWAHHPYPTGTNIPPTQNVRWPNVTMKMVPRFGASLDRWFKRKNIPIWLTEYAHETRPENSFGVTWEQQAAYMRTAFSMARANPRVAMFIWFVMRDDPGGPWKSGLLTQFGLEKPAFDTFSVLARLVDARNVVYRIKGGRPAPTLRFPALELAARSGVSTRVGITYKVFLGSRLQVVRQPESRIDRDGWVSFRPQFTPARGRTYRITVDSGDPAGNYVERTLTVIATR